MRIKLLLAGLAAALVVGMVPAPASADDATVTATLTGLTGTRTFALVEELTGVSLVSVGGGSTLDITGSFHTTVTETAATGDDNGYSVTASMTHLSNGTDTIDVSNIELQPQAFLLNNVAGTDAPAGAADFATYTSPDTTSAALPVWSNSGQSASSFYTFLHEHEAKLALTIPNEAATGTYSGTLTVTFLP